MYKDKTDDWPSDVCTLAVSYVKN